MTLPPVSEIFGCLGPYGNLSPAARFWRSVVIITITLGCFLFQFLAPSQPVPPQSVEKPAMTATLASSARK